MNRRRAAFSQRASLRSTVLMRLLLWVVFDLPSAVRRWSSPFYIVLSQFHLFIHGEHGFPTMDSAVIYNPLHLYIYPRSELHIRNRSSHPSNFWITERRTQVNVGGGEPSRGTTISNILGVQQQRSLLFVTKPRFPSALNRGLSGGNDK